MAPRTSKVVTGTYLTVSQLRTHIYSSISKHVKYPRTLIPVVVPVVPVVMPYMPPDVRTGIYKQYQVVRGTNTNRTYGTKTYIFPYFYY